MYSDINRPEVIRGLKLWKNKKNKFTIAMLHYTADEEKDPKRDGKEWFERERDGTLKSTWLKEYEIDFTTKSGKLVFGKDFCDFDEDVHFINSYDLPEPYELLISLDFGQRNPTAVLVGAWRDNILYIIDEIYEPALPSQTSKKMFEKFNYLLGGVENKSLSEKRTTVINTFSERIIDPTTRAKNRMKVKEGEEIPYSIIEEFWDHGWDFAEGNNDVNAGITRIREYFQTDHSGKSHLYIFRDKCPKLCWELKNYRYKELTEIQERTRNQPEEPIKKNDHSVDSLRYMVMTRPENPKIAPKPKTKIQKDIENLLKPDITIDNIWNID